MKNRRGQIGFTIVELLIVIVVIGVLAAISIVAYNGIQNRAMQTAAESDVANATKQIEAFRVVEDVYPMSISQCPPTATSLCLLQNSTADVNYSRIPASAYIPEGSYTLGALQGKQFSFYSPMELTSGNEFVRYADVAPYIDAHGLKEYKLSFDIKSADTSSRSTIQVYFQNGSSARYGGFTRNVNVTESYTHHELIFTPTLSNASEPLSYISFYGAYGTGNRPTIKNFRFEPN